MSVSCKLNVKLKPRAGRESITIDKTGRIVIAVTSPPVEGKANAHAIKLLCKKLKVSQSACSIIRGRTSRNKVLEVEGIDCRSVLEILNSK
jgi:hypothetical protein